MDVDQDIDQKINESFQSSELKFTKDDYYLILLIDIAEYSRIERNIEQLYNHNINFEVRKLNICDYVWIVRKKFGTQELMLPYIVDRNHSFDLDFDIISNQYKKRKFDIRNFGSPNVIFIFEEMNVRYLTTSRTTLFQTAINIKVHHNYKIKFTNSFNETALYISQMTQYLKTKFEDKILFKSSKKIANIYDKAKDKVPLMGFAEFQEDSMKNKELDLKSCFAKSLLMIRNMTIEKSLKIVEKYPTPKVLSDVYSTMNVHDGELLLSNIQFEYNKKIGKALSKSVYKFFTSTSFH